MNMRFYLVKGKPQTGLRFANNLNTWPSYIVEIINDNIITTHIVPGIE